MGGLHSKRDALAAVMPPLDSGRQLHGDADLPALAASAGMQVHSGLVYVRAPALGMQQAGMELLNSRLVHLAKLAVARQDMQGLDMEQHGMAHCKTHDHMHCLGGHDLLPPAIGAVAVCKAAGASRLCWAC